jgi:chemotaxis protein histidine kinase CheA
LNVINFVSNFLLEILLYGKYELIDTKIDLSFKKSFRTIDDYINFATKQLILSLQQHFVEYQLNKEHTQIHEIYDMIDQLRGNPNMLYDIEHIFRKIFPFSVFIVEKDNFIENYFELLECYVEYSTLIRLQEIKTNEPENDEEKLEEIQEIQEEQTKQEEKEIQEEQPIEKKIEQEVEEEYPESEKEIQEEQPDPESEKEIQEEQPDPESEKEIQQEQPDPESEKELEEQPDPESEKEIQEEQPEPESEKELEEQPEPESDAYFRNRMIRFPPVEPEPTPKSESPEKEEIQDEHKPEPTQEDSDNEEDNEDNESTTSSVQKVNPVREIVKDVLKKPSTRRRLPFTPEKDRVYTLEELNRLSRENVRRIGTSKKLRHMVKYRKGEVIDLILKKQEGRLDELKHVL